MIYTKLLMAEPTIHVPGRTFQKTVAIVNRSTPKDHYVQ